MLVIFALFLIVLAGLVTGYSLLLDRVPNDLFSDPF